MENEKNETAEALLNETPPKNEVSLKRPNFFLEEKKNKVPLLIGAIFIVLAGGISGYFLAQRGVPLPQGKIGGTPKKIVGSADTSVFKDKAEGIIEKGGIDGEGTHKLIREGGPEQTVYLTSSVVNLDEFLGRKVLVWGETFAAQKAGWLMDVGRVEVLE